MAYALLNHLFMINPNPPSGTTDAGPNPAMESLDQSEIDRILAESSAAPPAQIFIRADGSRDNHTEPVKVEPFDFRRPEFLTEFDLRRLRLINEDFIRYISSRLSLFLRMEFGAKMSRLTTHPFAKFTDGLPSPTHLCLFKVDPLVGAGILAISPRLALTIVDRLLGGRGQAAKSDRYLTEIEIVLIEDIINIVLDEWCKQWKGEQDLTPAIIGHENNGQFLLTATQDALFLDLSFEVNFGGCFEQIQIGVPYCMIEPMVKRIRANCQKNTHVVAAPKRATWQKSYERVDVPVSAQWDAFEMNLRELTCFRVGDVVEMPSRIIQQTQVLINGVPKFKGSVGVDDDRVSVQIVAKLPKPEEV